MKGFIGLTQSAKEDILKQHSKPYDGYAVGNVTSNMYPLTTYNDAKDTEGITMDIHGNVKTYTNHRINEIAAKNLHYDEIDPAYEFDSPGPQQSMTQMGMGKRPYDFDSKGPVDPYYGGGYHEDNTDSHEENDEYNFKDLLDMESLLDSQETNVNEVNESVNKTLEMFRKFKKY
jgi:hypothetical protein